MATGLVFTASKMKMDFLEALTPPTVGTTIIKAGWVSPIGDCFKLNVDAAFSQVTRIASFDMVARDSTWRVCLCTVSRLNLEGGYIAIIICL